MLVFSRLPGRREARLRSPGKKKSMSSGECVSASSEVKRSPEGREGRKGKTSGRPYKEKGLSLLKKVDPLEREAINSFVHVGREPTPYSPQGGKREALSLSKKKLLDRATREHAES